MPRKTIKTEIKSDVDNLVKSEPPVIKQELRQQSTKEESQPPVLGKRSRKQIKKKFLELEAEEGEVDDESPTKNKSDVKHQLYEDHEL